MNPWLGAGVSIFALCIVPLIYWSESGNDLALQFLFPVAAFFFAPFLLRFFSDRQRVINWSATLVLIASAAVIFEFLVGGYFENFSRSGLRATGPFVNPNNTGIVAALSAITVHWLCRQKAINALVLAGTISVVILTGSKTAGIIYIIGLLAIQQVIPRVFFAPSVALALVVYFSGLLEFSFDSELRSLSLESARIRAEDLTFLLEQAYSAPLADFLFGFTSKSLVDNAYVDILSFGGVFTLVVFALIQAWAAISNMRFNLRAVQLIFLLIMLAMFSTNVPRLWPLGHAYWAIIGVVAFRAIWKGGNQLPIKHTQSRLQHAR
jgi:hypothetical protein